MYRKSRKALVVATIGLMTAMVGCASNKPVRALAPAMFGLTRNGAQVCVEIPPAFDQTIALRNSGTAFVEQFLSPTENPPGLLFCGTSQCFA